MNGIFCLKDILSHPSALSIDFAVKAPALIPLSSTNTRHLSPDINPIPDFVEICDELFITSDSTSMISEAAANSNANIHIIMLDSNKKSTKFHELIYLVNQLDGKIDLTSQLKNVDL
jgi:hypothetical protein